jgi:hypothetical protein
VATGTRYVLLPLLGLALLGASNLALAQDDGARGDSAREARRHCKLHGHTVLRTKRLRVVRRKNNDGGVDLIGCVFRKGRSRKLATTFNTDTSSESARITRHAGTFVAIKETSGDQYHTSQDLRVVDVGSRRRYTAYLQVAAPGGGGFSPHDQGVELARYLLNRRGQLAAAFETHPIDQNGYTLPGSAPTKTDIAGFSSRGKRRALDSGSPADVPAASLRLKGRTVSWTHAGQPRSAEL